MTMRFRRALALILAAVVAFLGVPAPATAAVPLVGLDMWCAARTLGGGDVVVLGDSTSTGYGTAGYVGGNGDPWQDTYSGWAAALERSFTGTDWTVLSRNGALTRDYLPGGRWTSTVAFPDTIAAVQPALVVIMLGGNDYGIDIPVSDYQTNLQQITTEIRAAAPLASVVYVSMWSFSYRWASHPPVYTYPQYVEAARTVATLNGGIHVDLREDMPPADEHPETGLYLVDEFGPGATVHATDAGNWVVRAVLAHRLGCSL